MTSFVRSLAAFRSAPGTFLILWIGSLDSEDAEASGYRPAWNELGLKITVAYYRDQRIGPTDGSLVRLITTSPSLILFSLQDADSLVSEP